MQLLINSQRSKENSMSAALKRIEQTREALVGALAERDWEAIGKLDLACRACVDEVISHQAHDEPELRNNLEELLGVYRQLIDTAVGERQAIVDEMSQIQRAQNAAKVYHLFG
jgi:flagellar protein FliT